MTLLIAGNRLMGRLLGPLSGADLFFISGRTFAIFHCEGKMPCLMEQLNM